jgi:hypothetical protein
MSSKRKICPFTTEPEATVARLQRSGRMNKKEANKIFRMRDELLVAGFETHDITIHEVRALWKRHTAPATTNSNSQCGAGNIPGTDWNEDSDSIGSSSNPSDIASTFGEEDPPHIPLSPILLPLIPKLADVQSPTSEMDHDTFIAVRAQFASMPNYRQIGAGNTQTGREALGKCSWNTSSIVPWYPIKKPPQRKCFTQEQEAKQLSLAQKYREKARLEVEEAKLAEEARKEAKIGEICVCPLTLESVILYECHESRFTQWLWMGIFVWCLLARIPGFLAFHGVFLEIAAWIFHSLWISLAWFVGWTVALMVAAQLCTYDNLTNVVCLLLKKDDKARFMESDLESQCQADNGVSQNALFSLLLPHSWSMVGENVGSEHNALKYRAIPLYPFYWVPFGSYISEVMYPSCFVLNRNVVAKLRITHFKSIQVYTEVLLWLDAEKTGVSPNASTSKQLQKLCMSRFSKSVPKKEFIVDTCNYFCNLTRIAAAKESFSHIGVQSGKLPLD